ncbi:MAG TPA: translation initiation factor IF-2, partial [Cytophagales bacterium]|nr:translation initiation factor IF-2 [Cytophagales bacterium]
PEPAKPEPEPAKEPEKAVVEGAKVQGLKVLGKIDLDGKGKKPVPAEAEKPKPEPSKPEEPKQEAPAVEAAPVAKKEEAPAKKEEAPAPKPAPPVEKPAAKEQPPVEEAPAKPTPPAPVAEVKKEEPKPEVKPAEPVKTQEPAAPKPESKKEQPKPQEEKPKAPVAKDRPRQEQRRDSDRVKGNNPPPPPSEAKDKEGDKPKTPEEVVKAKGEKLKGLTVLGKIELPDKKPKPVASSDDKNKDKKKRKRKRIRKEGEGQQGGGRPGQQQGGGRSGQQQGGGQGNNQGGGRDNNNRGGRDNRRDNNRGKKPPVKKEELTDKEIQEQIKQTLARLSGGKKGGAPNRAKYRREKRSAAQEAEERRMAQEMEEAKVLKVAEFVSANDLASLMDTSVNDVISACLGLGMFVSINQRLDAESITIIADEFGYEVEFASAEDETEVEEVEDAEEDLKDRAPIVTIMGHVDHGKTSLLDYIRDAKVAAGEAGGITQHIGAYDVMTETGKRIAFLDTPGHEAFTAMRARGAKITDVAIIVVAADDAVMPQTKEAINHAQVADVPIVIALNKIDKPNANPDKIKEELANINILVEDWGGKYQCQPISAKTGEGIEELLEKVLLESELLELKANPDRRAVGSVVEASLDKGRGYVTTIMVQSGTLKVGDTLLSGAHYGKVKAMMDHRGNRIKIAGPSTPVQMLGLDGAPQAGEKFYVMDTDREAREMATKRAQLQREQSMRTKKHITLDEIGRRLAIGNFRELNVIVKGDVDGSIEALSDSLLKLSTPEVAVNIIHKAVGQISESDVLLASASDAIIIGFQVRPSGSARKLAENEEIEIRLYSIIYDAINEIKDAMEGMLAPEVEEKITGNAEVREVFKISKVGTVAGCYVTDGFLKRQNKVRLIREGIVVYEGEIDALKRFKDDVNEVKQSYECGISIVNFNDIKQGDVIEGFELVEVKRTLTTN